MRPHEGAVPAGQTLSPRESMSFTSSSVAPARRRANVGTGAVASSRCSAGLSSSKKK